MQDLRESIPPLESVSDYLRRRAAFITRERDEAYATLNRWFKAEEEWLAIAPRASSPPPETLEELECDLEARGKEQEVCQREQIKALARICKLMHHLASSTNPMPGMKPSASIYLGQSQALGGLIKIGFTSDPDRRSQEINKCLGFLGFDQDFEMLEVTTGARRDVVAIEKQSTRDLNHVRRGGEWFIDTPEVWDWYAAAADGVLALRTDEAWDLDVEQSIAALAKRIKFSIFELLELEDLFPQAADHPRLRRIKERLEYWRRLGDLRAEWVECHRALAEEMNSTFAQ